MMAASTKETLKQTSKAILFQEFTSDIGAESLSNILDLYDDPTKAAMDSELAKLEVKSFEEFIEKFKPKIYEICEYIDQMPRFTYTISKDVAMSRNGVEKDLTDNTFYKMVMRMYDAKGKSGSDNLSFDDSEILEMLLPAQEQKEACDIRKNLQSATERYLELKSKGENADNFSNTIKKCRDKIVQKYQNSVLGLLPLAMQDLDVKRECLEERMKYLQLNSGGVESGTPLIAAGRAGFDEYGNLIVVPVTNSPEPAVLLPSGNYQDEASNKLYEVIGYDYERYSIEDRKNSYEKSLILDTYVPLESNNNADNSNNNADNLPMLAEELNEKITEYAQRKNTYEKIYVQAKNEFINTLADVCTRLLSVKVFFDHATLDGKLESGLIVTNCNPTDLLNDGVRKEKLKRFLRHRGKDQTSKKIWFAIIPGIDDGNTTSGVPNDDPFGELYSHEESSKGCKALNPDTLKEFLTYLDESKIMTIFSYKASKKNGFDEMSEEYIREIKEVFGEYNNSHAVFAYPNFAVVREREIPINKENKTEKITVPGIYIDACYPAAGLLVGSQQIEYLEKNGYQEKVRKDDVCVHVDLEETKTKILTKFNRELSTRWSQEIKSKINEDMFGFAFCGDEFRVDGELINNTYVYTARTLKKSNSVYRPIYRILTEDFVYVYTNTLPDKKVTTIKEFIRKDVQSWKDKAQQKDNIDMINLVLKKGEDISFDEVEKTISITFNGEVQTLNDIKIISD